MGSSISIGLAFLAGLASFLSPCVFSLVPAYIGYLGGGGENRSENRLVTFTHGLAFVFGFSVVFVFLGVMHYVEVEMGVVMVIVGLMLFFNVFPWISTYGQFFWLDFGL